MRTDSLVPWRRHRPAGNTGQDLPGQDLHREFSRFFDDMVGGGFLAPFSSEENGFGALDLTEKNGAFHVSVDLPGCEEKDIDIELSGNRLAIHAERQRAAEEEAEGFHQIERSFGSMTRSVTLPDEVDPDKVEAHFKDGVLHLNLQKSDKVKERTRKIKIAH